jgi:hypothetical protein
MATDVDVQYFSHLNGLTLGNNWGDLIRLLDKALVTGIDFTQITAASIDAQGDVHITLSSAHNVMLFQVVELFGFTPSSLNQKYRIKGVPSATQLILKPKTDIVERSITAIGTGKLASLGYEIIFRDTNDVKRVYRAKNPSAQHPFIRVDESLASDTGTYTSTYAKYAIVGLLEHMDHIDDYENPDALQLPYDATDLAKNWKITGTGAACVRGWSRWYWTANGFYWMQDSESQTAGGRHFTILGDADAFYFAVHPYPVATDVGAKMVYGCGIFESALDTLYSPWFLAANFRNVPASSQYANGGYSEPFIKGDDAKSYFLLPKEDLLNKAQVDAFVVNPVLSDSTQTLSGTATRATNPVAAIQFPILDKDRRLRGNLKHLHYAAKKHTSSNVTTPIIAGSSMYVWDSCTAYSSTGGFYYYLGELE